MDQSEKEDIDSMKMVDLFRPKNHPEELPRAAAASELNTIFTLEESAHQPLRNHWI
jgi:hypothetical protein